MAQEFSLEYLQAWLEKARQYLPKWLVDELHRVAFPSAGGKARWRKPEEPTPLEKLALREINPKKLREIDNEELQMIWLRLHQWYANAIANKKPTEQIINAGVWVLNELKERGIQYTEDDFVKEIERLSKEESITWKLSNLPQEIVVIPDFINIVGSTVYGKKSDIDVVIRANREVNVKEDGSVEDYFLISANNVRLPLRKVLDPDKEGILSFIDAPQGPHSDYIPLYSLVLRKEKPEIRVIKEDNEEKKEEVMKFEPFTNFTPPKPRMAGYTEAYSVEDLIKWAKGRKIAIEPKYNGFRCIVERKGDKIRLWYEGTPEKNRIDNFPEIRAKLPNKDFTFDGDLGIEKNGHREPRYLLNKLNSDNFELEEGEKVVLTLFDVLYWDGKDLTNEPFEKRREILESIKFEEPIRISELRWAKTEEEIKMYTKWAFSKERSEGLVAKVADSKYGFGGVNDFFKLKKVVELKVIVLDVQKTKDGNYVYRGGLLPGVSDYKNIVELDREKYIDLGKTMPTSIKAKKGDIITVQILELIDNPKEGTLTWMNAMVMDVDDTRKEPYYAEQAIDIAKRKDLLQKNLQDYVYSEINPYCKIVFVIDKPSATDKVRNELLTGKEGKVFKEHYLPLLGLQKSQVGIITTAQLKELKQIKEINPFLITVGLGHVLKSKCTELDVYLPFPCEDESFLKAISGELQRKTKQIKNKLQEIRKIEEEEEGGGEEFWKQHWFELFPKSGKGKFVYQMHWRGLSKEETKLSHEELLQTNHSVHGDLRFENRDFDLWGFTVFEGSTAEIRQTKSGSRLIDLPPNDNLQGTFKQNQPKAWLKVGIEKPYIAEPLSAGATSETYAKFFALDWGEYEIGVWREHMIELFLHGNKLKGRMLITYTPVGGRRVWLIDRPEDQTPYAEKRDIEDVIKELKAKKQKYLVWRNPNEGGEPKLIDVEKFSAELKNMHIVKIDEEKRLVYGVVYEPDSIDAQNEYTTAEEIENAAHVYLSKYRVLGEMHSKVAEAEVVESYIAPVDFKVGDELIKKGSWVLVTHILSDRLWEAIKEGKYTGYSMGGWAEKS